MSEVLSLKNISRTYNQGGRVLNVLEGFNLDITSGETVALVGPSGSGKTTLLQIAGLLDAPDSGEIVINGKSMTGASDGVRTYVRRSAIGFVYQFHHLLPEFSALENVAMPQMIAGRAQKAAEEKALVLLQSLGLAERVRHRPAKLSGGEQQRVAIARALANDPQLLLADEPTGNLDPHTAEQVFAMLLSAAKSRGMAALVATHNPALAKKLDRTVSL